MMTSLFAFSLFSLLLLLLPFLVSRFSLLVARCSLLLLFFCAVSDVVRVGMVMLHRVRSGSRKRLRANGKYHHG